MGFAMIAEVRAYWEALRDGADLPRRAQIDPRGIEGALESAFLLERVAPGIARFRLAGMQLNDLMGMEVRGMPLSSFFEPGSRNRMAEGLEQVFSLPGALELRLEAERSLGRPALEARMLLLPLRSERGPVDLALGCLACEGQIGRSPRRFAIASQLVERLQSPVPVRPAPQPDARPLRKPAAVTGMSEAAAPFRPAPPRGKPNLRLVKSDE
ncbi:PAS domain-containing protein [Paracoccaceae bacterium Fryx2]|nr:PAS domain-containing protein [Paracoccaceae bacterium Fryx2]